MDKIQTRTWPLITDIDAIEEDNAKTIIERGDALLKAQDDGLKSMEARMSSLFAQSITLASAAIAATATAFAASLSTQTSSPPPPPWAVMWVGQSLAVLSAVWLAAVGVAAASMLSQTWTASGMQPHDLYNEAVLTAPPKSLRLAISRALQEAIDRNSVRTIRYVRRLAWVVGLLASGPLFTAITALWLARPPLRPLTAIAALLAGYICLIWHLYRRVRATPSYQTKK
jgi:hypothetical protein